MGHETSPTQTEPSTLSSLLHGFDFVYSPPANNSANPRAIETFVKQRKNMSNLDLSESLVASLARALNSDQVPCVLWGHYLLNVHGVPSIIGVGIPRSKEFQNQDPELMLCKSIDFIIPDDLFEVGTRALTQFKSLTPCPDGEACPSSSQERYTPPPAFYVHIEDSEVTVGLYPQSETLWFLPPLDSSFSSPREIKLPSQFILASD